MEREYREYFSDASMRHAIGKLTRLRGLIQDGPIRDALGTALDCTKYLRADVYRDWDYLAPLCKGVDGIVKDYGPRGYYYMCKQCGETHWSPNQDFEGIRCECGRIARKIRVEPIGADDVTLDDKLALIRDILASMSPDELAAVKSKMSK